mmetsp:Transcript_23786/g.49396  ORF Transcript_23786/g.49396 Transcript_23786/m.49396 type:complete len:93 (+) Transcript_23786:99-377(+)
MVFQKTGKINSSFWYRPVHVRSRLIHSHSKPQETIVVDDCPAASIPYEYRPTERASSRSSSTAVQNNKESFNPTVRKRVVKIDSLPPQNFPP